MLFVCHLHVKSGLELFDTPHIQKAYLNICCAFCGNKSEFEMGYYK